MPDEPQLVRGIDWKSAFPFTLIFRSFRVAIHPSKLILALLALLLIYFGGRVLDAIWPEGSRAVPGELAIYAATRGEANSSQAFVEGRAHEREAIVNAYHEHLKLINKPDGGLSDIKASILEDRAKAVELADKAFDASAVSAKQKATLAAFDAANAEWAAAQAIRGEGLFTTFFLQQAGLAHKIIQSAYEGHWTGQMGVFDQFINLLTLAPGWAIRHHPIFFTLFGLYALIVWAIFAGAVARIAAVQVARDEKISFRQALAFSSAKFLSFISAPIIPLAIILIIGLVVAAGGLLINFPFFGPIIAGALFFLALAAGFIMTLVLIGLLGGFNLMYPTIAVEGSDSFDAISRSFSYLFARPWRMGFYTLVAAAYGTICYVFLRYFIKLILSMTHLFVGLGVFVNADSTAPLWPVMWPDPLTAPQLSYPLDTLTLGSGQYMGAFFVAFWVYLTIAVLGAFVISFYISANTIIYVLMRHEVDATELDDVYLEQTEDDFADAAAPAAVTVPSTDAPQAGGAGPAAV